MQAEYTNGYAALFDDGVVEFVSVQQQYTYAYLGTFRVADDDSYAIVTLTKDYDGESEGYYWISGGGFTTNIRQNAQTGLYVMPMQMQEHGMTISFDVHMTLSNEYPQKANIPTDPNGDSYDPQYQIYKASYDNLIINRGILYNYPNYTVTHNSPYNNGLQVVDITETFKAENYKFSVQYSSTPTQELIYERTTENLNNNNAYIYTCYVVQINENAERSLYSTTPNDELYYDNWDDDIGLIEIPFNNLRYDGETHAYYAAQYVCDPNNEDTSRVTAIRYYFSNGRLSKVTFKDYTQYQYEYNFAAHNQTTIDIPEGGGGGGGQQNTPSAEDYYTEVQNRAFVYKEAWGNNFDDDEKALLNEAYAGGTLSLFTNHSAQLHFDKESNGTTVQDTPVTYYGTFDLSEYHNENPNDIYVRGDFRVTHIFDWDGDYYSWTDSMPFRYYLNNNEIRLQFGNQQYLQFTRTNNLPVDTPHDGGGGGADPQPVFVPQLHYGYGSSWLDEPMPASGPYLAKIEHFYLYENEEFSIQLETDRWLHYEDYNSSPDLAGGMIAQGSELYGTHNFLVLEDGYYDIRVNDSYKVIIEHETSGGGGGGDPVSSTWPTDYVNAALTTWGIQNDTVPACDGTGVSSFVTNPNAGVAVNDDEFTIGAIGGADKYDSYIEALGNAGYSDVGFGMYMSTYAELIIMVSPSDGNLTILVMQNPGGAPIAPSDPSIYYVRSGLDCFETLEYDSVNQQYYIEDMYFNEGEDFCIIMGASNSLFYESFGPYIGDPDTANGKVTQGAETMPGYHWMHIEEDGDYSIYINSSNEIYIVHGPQAPSGPFMQYGSDLNGWDYEELTQNGTQWEIEGIWLDANTEIVFHIGDAWYHSDKFVPTENDKGNVGAVGQNLVALEEGYYSFYINMNEGGNIYAVYSAD